MFTKLFKHAKFVLFTNDAINKLLIELLNMNFIFIFEARYLNIYFKLYANIFDSFFILLNLINQKCIKLQFLMFAKMTLKKIRMRKLRKEKKVFKNIEILSDDSFHNAIRPGKS